MPNKFNHCPQCNGERIEQTDYEDENGKEDVDGRRCLDCKWEGSIFELVCAD